MAKIIRFPIEKRRQDIMLRNHVLKILDALEEFDTKLEALIELKKILEGTSDVGKPEKSD